jgi:hypothetical protein
MVEVLFRFSILLAVMSHATRHHALEDEISGALFYLMRETMKTDSAQHATVSNQANRRNSCQSTILSPSATDDRSPISVQTTPHAPWRL